MNKGHYKRKLNKLEHEAIIHYFYTHRDNRTGTIAKFFGIERTLADSVITRHLKEKVDRINERVNKPKNN